MKKKVNHPNGRSVDLQTSPSTDIASEALVRHGAIVEEIGIDGEFSKVKVHINDNDIREGYIISKFLIEVCDED